MARKLEIAELTTKFLMNELGSGKRYKRILVFGGIGVMVLAGAIVAITGTIDARATAARASAFGGLETCLLGAEPLKNGETAGTRLAYVKLGVVGVPPEKRLKANELPWPASCASYAYELKEHAGDSPLATAADALGKALRADVSALADLRAETDKVWAEAASAGVQSAPPAGAPAAPKAAVPLYSAEQWKALPKLLSGNMSLANVHESTSPGTKLHFVVDQKDMPEGPVRCSVNATEATIKCMKVPENVAKLSPGLQLIGSIDGSAQPFYFAGDRGGLGIFPPDGRHALAMGVTYGASARADGSLALLTRHEGSKDLRLTLLPANGPAIDQALLPASEVDWPGQTTLAWDWFAYRSIAKAGRSHLIVRKIEGSVVKPSVEVGELDEPAPSDKSERDSAQVAICKGDEAIAVRVRGQRNDAVAFFTGGRWAAPVKASTRGGAFTCRGLEAITTTVEHVADRDKDLPTITQARCNPSGCTTTKIELRSMLGDIGPVDAASSVAADVGGKLMFLWNAGLAGGLRMRLGAPDRFKDLEDIILTDGRDNTSHVSSIAQLKVLSTNQDVVVLFATTSGVKVLRVDAAGKVTPFAASM